MTTGAGVAGEPQRGHPPLRALVTAVTVATSDGFDAKRIVKAKAMATVVSETPAQRELVADAQLELFADSSARRAPPSGATT